MKYTIISIFTVVSTLASTLCDAQNLQLLGTSMPYDTSDIVYPKPPQGYKAVMIQHLGRHGSRYPIDDLDILYVTSKLAAENALQNLTPNGVKLYQFIQKLAAVSQGHWGDLSPLGVAQQSGIGERLVTNLGFRAFISAKVWCDPEERCKDSFKAFMSGLESHIVPDPLEVIELQRKNDLLNFFEVDADYLAFKRQNSWQDKLDEFEREMLKENDVADYFLVNTGRLTEVERINFAVALYNCVAISYNISFDKSLRPVIDSQNLSKLWQVQNVRQYLEKGPSPIAKNIQVDISLPLLKNFVASSEAELKERTYTSYLRFAHAETIIPFAAMLEIPDANIATVNLSKLSGVWQDYRIAPMAANIVWVFYQNKNGHCLVMMMQNEHPVAFPVSTSRFPFYEWGKVKRYYEKRIRLLESAE